MCFVKTRLTYRPMELFSAFSPVKSETAVKQEETSSVGSKLSSEHLEEMAFILHKLLISNSQAIDMTIQKADKVLERLEEDDALVSHIGKNTENVQKEHSRSLIQPVSPFLEALFGKKNYSYSLKLTVNVPKLLYKERNFNIEIELVDQQGNLVRNSICQFIPGNVIPLHFGVCTTEGNWIHENRQGQAIIKGKNETQLYQGRATFQKVYFRDVTKAYPGSKFLFVVYPKASLIKFNKCGVFDQKIEEVKVMPLLIDNITVLAKKKTQY